MKRKNKLKNKKVEMHKVEFVAPVGAVEFDPLTVVDDKGVFAMVDTGAKYPDAVRTHYRDCGNCSAKDRPLARLSVAALGSTEVSEVCAECAYDLLMGCAQVNGRITVETTNAARAEMVLSQPEKHRAQIGSAMSKEIVSALMSDILQRGIKSQAAILDPIISAGDIAVVVYMPSAVGEEAARVLGWDGTTPAFRMSARVRANLIANLEEVHDHVAAKWLRGHRAGRIFVIAQEGTLLVNFEPGLGYSLEPGSTQRGMA